jgi:diaminopimelate epimerase
MKIEFSKFQEQMISIGQLEWEIRNIKEQIRKICDRRFRNWRRWINTPEFERGYDFAMQYYNADGKESTMCGNGGRCLVKFAYQQGLHKDNYILAADGPHRRN